MTAKRKYGFSQGRLTPSNELQRFPYEAWEKEFFNAEELDIDFIELLTEREFNKKNPVWTHEGRQKIKKVCKSSKRKIFSICVDYIINHSMIDDSNSSTFNHLQNVLTAASDLGCKIIILPLLEESNIDEVNMEKFIPIIRDLSTIASSYGIIICIESLMNASNLVLFLNKINKSNVKAVFDTGNRVTQPDGRDLYSEILKLGDHIGHVHIKDKNSNGENVILGTGLVNFLSVFLALKKIKYFGALNFETTRGSNPLDTARYHMSLCDFFQKDVNGE